jgi:hypothetical protein
VASRAAGEYARLAVVDIRVAVVTAARSAVASVSSVARTTVSSSSAAGAARAVDVLADEAVAGLVAGEDAGLAVL